MQVRGFIDWLRGRNGGGGTLAVPDGKRVDSKS